MSRSIGFYPVFGFRSFANRSHVGFFPREEITNRGFLISVRSFFIVSNFTPGRVESQRFRPMEQKRQWRWCFRNFSELSGKLMLRNKIAYKSAIKRKYKCTSRYFTAPKALEFFDPSSTRYSVFYLASQGEWSCRISIRGREFEWKDFRWTLVRKNSGH